jgi:hypothetical protein
MIESSATDLTSEEATPTPFSVDAILGPEGSVKTVDGAGLFETGMYMSGMHGGHGAGKTSSFKRCVFLKGIGAEVAEILVAALETRPTPLCYFHLLHGGGTVGDVAPDATAFGCRDWEFACVVTGVWPREHDGTEVTQAAVQWVYNVVGDLLPMSSGVYGADLGPDPRDTMLAVKAFGPNRPRLALLKHNLDPGNVLAYACPLATDPAPVPPKVIVLVTGESGVGKDHCAKVWCSLLLSASHKRFEAKILSISDATKQEYAANTGADLNRLLCDRAYKEQHRPALTSYFENELRQRPQLLEEQFLQVVENGAGMDVLLITGMRDKAPLASYSHLVPDGRLLEVRVGASKDTQQLRRGRRDDGGEDGKDSKAGKLPPPTISVMKSASHVAFSASESSRTQRIEMGRDVIPRGSSVVMVDDVLATGETLCAVLQLLAEGGIAAKDIVVMVVAEFPLHRGRQLLCQHGFGGVKIQSLLVFGGA